MLGFSIYLGESFNTDYIQRMLKLGYRTIFTSLQIPEEHHIETQFTQLQTYLSQFETELIIDINDTLISADLFERLAQFNTIRYIIRIDEGTTPAIIQHIISHGHTCCINASTVSEQFLTDLQDFPQLQKHLIYLHNYYPRPDTGLSRTFLQHQNARIRHYHHDATIYAFISGEQFRGPLYEGLTTLECTRQIDPCLAALILRELNINGMLIGDPFISATTSENLFQMIEHNHFILPCHLDNGADTKLILQKHISRPDCSAHVVRSKYTRQQVARRIEPFNVQPRAKGTITIDNHLNGRYMGELQITKINLKPHPHVNVVGHISKDSLPYLNYFNASTAFTFIQAKGEF